MGRDDAAARVRMRADSGWASPHGPLAGLPWMERELTAAASGKSPLEAGLGWVRGS